jgi:hypothetical protein
VAAGGGGTLSMDQVEAKGGWSEEGRPRGGGRGGGKGREWVVMHETLLALSGDFQGTGLTRALCRSRW